MTPEQVCQSKRRYADEILARAGAASYLGSGHATITKLWVYRCDVCRGWHWTSKPKSRKTMVTAQETFHQPMENQP